MKVYAVLNKEKGYLCENEDTIGLDYCFEIDEYTLLFNNREDALFNSGHSDIVLDIIIDPGAMEYLII